MKLGKKVKIEFESDELTTEILDVCLKLLKLADKIEEMESEKSDLLARRTKRMLRMSHQQMRKTSVLLFKASHTSVLIKKELSQETDTNQWKDTNINGIEVAVTSENELESN